MRVFYVIYIREEPLKSYINAVRLLCNPAEKNSAHLTVRGPYKRRYSKDELAALNKQIRDEPVHIYGCGHFFGPTQNTVFLDCDSPRLREVWHKPDYGYRPHITLYDGSSRKIADALLRMVSDHSFNLCFRAEGLSQLTVRSGQTNLILRCDTNPAIVAHALGRPLDFTLLDSMQEAERLTWAGRVIEKLSALSEPLHQDRRWAAVAM